jgi:LPXTG-motif cell wall-anchored protein
MRKILFLAAITLFILHIGAAQPSNPRLEVKTIKTEPTPLQTSEYADIWVKLVNEGDRVAQNTTLTFKPGFPFSTDPQEKTRWNVGDIYPAEEYRIHFQVKVDKNAVHGPNDLTFTTATGDSNVIIEHDVEVQVRTDDEALVINDIQFPDKIGPGTSADLDMTLSNLADSQLKNIDITLDTGSDDLPFATTGTNRKRMQEIESGASHNISFRINVDESAENGVYKLPINLDYENEAGTSFNVEESTGIVVGGDSQLEVGLNSRELKQAGQPGTVTLRIVNRGDGKAKFVDLTLQNSDNYEILTPSSVYLGNLNPDDYQSAEFELYGDEGTDSLTLPVNLKYKDAEGASRSITQELELELYSDDQMEQFSSTNTRNHWLYIVGVFLVIGAALLYWRRRR